VDLAEEVHIGNQQIDAKGHPNLCHYGIGIGPQKALDLQVLLDLLERQLDLRPIQ